MLANRTLQAASGTASGYKVQRSLRFRSSASAYLNRTPTSAGSRKLWTWSGWVKRGQLGTVQELFMAGSASSDYTAIFFNSTDGLVFHNVIGSANAGRKFAIGLSRDTSAYYHVVAVMDTDNATANDRMILYVNGSRITSYSPDENPALGDLSQVSNNVVHRIGVNSTSLVQYFDGYLSEVNFIDGQALTPSSFGQTSTTTGSWVAKRYTGTYGTNGFYLPFSDTSSVTALGYDASTNSRTYSVASTFNFTVPSYSSSLVVKLWGGGGGGGGGGSTFGNNGTAGTATTFSTLSAGGGGGGTGAWTANPTGTSGAGGSASGGDINTTGNSVATVNGTTTGAGAPNGGGNVVATANAEHYNGTTPGGGATGGRWAGSGNPTGGGGGSGAYVQKTYSVGDLTPGTVLSVTVGAGGTGGSSDADQGANGAAGRIMVIVDGVVTNDWTPNNISLTSGATYDSMLDVPAGNAWADGGNGRGNYATLLLGASSTAVVMSQANLSVTTAVASSSNFFKAMASIAVSSGKWYFEDTIGGLNLNNWGLSISGTPPIVDSATNQNGQLTGEVTYIAKDSAGTPQESVYVNGGVVYTTTSTVADGHVVGIAFDADARTVQFYRQNVAVGTAYTINSATVYYISLLVRNNITACIHYVNFGQRPFTYTPPSGFKALHTGNLTTPTIKKSNQHFDTSLWRGDGVGAQAVTNSGNFQPDLVWMKGRNLGSAGQNNVLVDSIRGINNVLSSNLTNAEAIISSIAVFNSNGFTTSGTIDNGYSGSINNMPYVGWQWKAGGTAVSNTAGSVTSQVSANVTSGFSIVSYTGTGANATVGHGLGVAPSMVIVKRRDTTADWDVWHVGIGDGTKYMVFTTQVVLTAANIWNSAIPTSSIINIGTHVSTNSSGGTYVAYCFSEISGFSKFGSYTGNGAADGPFLYFGFRPKYIMYKRTDTTGNWNILDTSRETFNAQDSLLRANLNMAEEVNTVYNQDFLSNGWKIRSTNVDINVSGATYIYAAFAEAPFKYANAR